MSTEVVTSLLTWKSLKCDLWPWNNLDRKNGSFVTKFSMLGLPAIPRKTRGSNLIWNPIWPPFDLNIDLWEVLSDFHKILVIGLLWNVSWICKVVFNLKVIEAWSLTLKLKDWYYGPIITKLGMLGLSAIPTKIRESKLIANSIWVNLTYLETKTPLTSHCKTHFF